MYVGARLSTCGASHQTSYASSEPLPGVRRKRGISASNVFAATAGRWAGTARVPRMRLVPGMFVPSRLAGGQYVMQVRSRQVKGRSRQVKRQVTSGQEAGQVRSGQDSCQIRIQDSGDITI